MTAVETRSLRVVYSRGLLGRPLAALEGLDLTVEEGEIFGYLGPNGAGKTTTIKCLVGLLRPTAGAAFVMGASVNSPESRRGIGFVPEDPYFYEYLTGEEFLDFMGRLSGLSRDERRARTPEMLERVGLKEAGGSRLRGYSRGMRQRIGLAQAFLHRPRLAILDEPMGGLDPVGRRDVREFILKMRKAGTTILFSSHILADVEAVCDHVGILNRGRLIATGALSEILSARVVSQRVRVKGLSEEAAGGLGAGDVHRDGDVLSFSLPGDKDTAELLSVVSSRGATLVSLEPERENLEDVFMRLTEHEAEGQKDAG